MELRGELIFGDEATGFPVKFALVSTFLIILVLNSVYKMHFSRVGQLMRGVRGPPNLPLIGIIYYCVNFNVREDFFELVKRVKERYGPVFGGFIGHRPFVYLTTVKQATVLLRSGELDKSQEYFVFQNLVGDGMLLSNGSKWASRRKMIIPSVGLTLLREFTSSFNRQAGILVNILGSEVANSKTPCDIEDYINRCLLDISFESFMGRDLNAQQNRFTDFLKAINGVFEINCERLWKPWKQSDLFWTLSGNKKIEDRFLSVIQSFLAKTIAEERLARKNKPKKLIEDEEGGGLLIDILLEKLETGELTEKDLRDEILTILIAARDTSTRTIIVTLFLLALHPDHQREVQREVEDLFGSGDPEVKFKDASNLKYLDSCIKESLRLLTVVPFFARTLKQELHVGDGLILPRGATCMVLAGLVHRDPEVYHDPDTFRPQRFLEDKQLIDPYTFLGFSAGRRNCPGQKFAMLSVKTIIAHLMMNFDISTSQRMEDVKWTVDLIQKPMTPILFNLRHRLSTPATTSRQG